LSKRVIAWQLVQNSGDLFIDGRGDVARGAWVVESTNQARALIHPAVSCIAVVNDLL
jgi:phage protein U